MMTPTTSPKSGVIARWLARPWVLTLWCMVAAFGAYATMYGFRKPWTAAGFAGAEYSVAFKTWLVTAQVIGYMLSKCLGIKIIAEMVPARRAAVFLALIGVAQAALLGFGLTPAPWSLGWLFLNGLALGLVFGLVLGFVEGRCMTEFFIAGHCASFILADGVAKTVGAWLLVSGVSERWMPFAAGLFFALPLLLFVWMLKQIPAPNAADIEARAERATMTAGDRWAMLRRHGLRLMAILLMYLLITVLRSIRADFAPEIWVGLGLSDQPGVFASSEFWIALAIVVINGSLVFVRDNRLAFFASLGLSALGLVLVLVALLAQRAGALTPFAFMVLLGFGMYLPYVAVHTTVFERLIAITRERGNIGYLMYLADSIGYLGYAGVMLSRSLYPAKAQFLDFFLNVATGIAATGLVLVLISIVLYSQMKAAPLTKSQLAEG